MVHRRALITGTMLGGALSALAAPAAGAGGLAAAESQTASQISERQLQEVANAVQAVREEIAHQATFWELTAVREQARSFLRANGKFPDFIEVGSDLWQRVYDWHVRFQQPINLGRTAEGRYTILLLATNIVMRPDMPTGFIGMGYDNR